MKKITTYLFDLGGVIVDLDYQKTINEFSGKNEMSTTFILASIF